MKKATVLLLIQLSSFSMAFSQEIPEIEKEKKFDHYIGVQLNQMMRNFLNLFDDNAILKSDNLKFSPYLLNYSINRKSNGLGLNFGLAYILENYEEPDGSGTKLSEWNDFSFRFGGEQKVNWGNKWMASLGVDILYAKLNQGVTTFSENHSSRSWRIKTEVYTQTKSNSFGAGPRGTIHYRLGKKVLLGTEASFYYTIHEIDAVQTTTTNKSARSGGGFTYTETNTETDSQRNSQWVFYYPIVFLLTVQF